ncbi:PASTA domain-containing protein [Streptomyces sp. NBC_00557]|uniref:PASTA domain-containing protein n=1 Tax=Streptomyces sp. NBC_00557 TaxID=2975776 RepID=UPI002E801F89|nr:hypothetical protein [Streptomyces sp. NBC_00557]WUC36718.1 hypothetical protein OG956_22100 [Streptomyces sp. NBC_00557]
MKARHLARLGSLITVSLLLAACTGHQTGAKNDSHRRLLKMESVVGKTLKQGIDGAVDASLGVSPVDATDQHRYIDVESAERYTICFQQPVPEMQAVKFYVVPASTRCPRSIGGKGAASRIPGVTGKRAEDAKREILYAGYQPARIRFYAAANKASEVKASSLGGLNVCDQHPEKGAEVVPTATVKLFVGAKCRQ